MNEEVKVSVIIPTYKRPQRLLRSVNSVLSQSYANFEIIIVNDDNENVTFKGLLEGIKDERVKIINNSRVKGATGARNTGILSSKGRYISFLDDDDEFLPNNLFTQVQNIENSQNTVGVAYGGYSLETKKGWKSIFVNKEGDILNEFIAGKFSMCSGSNSLVKREVIDNVGLWDEELQRQQDLEFMIRVLSQYKVVFNNNLIVKIYGHNEPNPLKAYNEREKFIIKIGDFIKRMTPNEQSEFYSNHYRRQTNYLIKLKKYKKGFNYWKKAIKYKSISIRKDSKIIISLFKSLIA